MVIRIKERVVAAMVCMAIMAAALMSAHRTETFGSTALPIIMYHHISADPSKLGTYVISPEQFESDLKYIKAWGYTTVTAAQLIDFAEHGTPLPKKSVMITFDDGYLSFYEYAYPLLKQYGMTAVLSVIGKYADIYSESDDRNVQYAHATWDNIREMSQSGAVEIGNHTYQLHTLSDRKGSCKKADETVEQYRKMLTEDISKMQERIKTATGSRSCIFTFPFGRVCDEGEQVVRDMGFKITLGCEEKINYIKPNDPEELYMLMRFNRPSGQSSDIFFKNKLP
ncbi:MAG: polysaccharide deacetylase family protein [Firmicutes bacterium]|nr:polysaccharide deacetylase family protein [Bacillota bacterium]